MDIALAPITFTIVIATLAVTIVAFRNEQLFERFLLSVDGVRRGQWYRMLTSGLIHADWPHLLANMFSLFAFGTWMEHVISSWRFGMLYVLGVLMASFTSVIMNRRSVDYRAVGASGGVCAVIGGATVIFPESSIMVFPLPVGIPGWIFGALFLVYSIVGAREQWDNVGHAAHLGGTIFGMGLMASFYPAFASEHYLYVIGMACSGLAAWVYVARLKGRLRS